MYSMPVCRANELHAELSLLALSKRTHGVRVYQINQDRSQINQEIWVSKVRITLTRYSPALTTRQSQNIKKLNA